MLSVIQLTSDSFVIYTVSLHVLIYPGTGNTRYTIARLGIQLSSNAKPTVIGGDLYN
jgi:hypothetical protein